MFVVARLFSLRRLDVLWLCEAKRDGSNEN